MGLHVSHGAYEGSCTSFNHFRKKVAECIGGSFAPAYHKHYNEKLNPEKWYWWAGEGKINPFGFGPKTHPGLEEFFNHSDCEGDISPEMCLLVARDLEQLIPMMERIEDPIGRVFPDGGDVEILKSFIRGCQAAAASNEQLHFF